MAIDNESGQKGVTTITTTNNQNDLIMKYRHKKEVDDVIKIN